MTCGIAFTRLTVNGVRDDPMNILACVTALIYHPFLVKTLFSKCHCESHLQRQECRVGAPSNASCGLIFFSYYSMFPSCFLNGIENGSRNLPSCPVAAKQVLLDKPFAKDTPGTTLQAIATVATSSLPWQIFGGIKGRKMNDAHTLIRLEIDHAKSAGSHTLGVKLDKSKCFDRLIPAVTAAHILYRHVP